ncbi:MAG: peptidoglycan DD-metalloendopeptidase family protein [Clostridia bacterium]|nr:peptidoglycan DD-metalloendopeptidase family protein [Clostridia bacterium]
MKTRTTRIITSIIAILLVLGMLLSLGGSLFYSYAASNQSTLKNLQSQLATIKDQRSALVAEKKAIEAQKAEVDAQVADAQAKLDELEAREADIMDEKVNLDQQMNLTMEAIEVSEQILSELAVEINDTTVELHAAQEDEAEQYALFKQRLRAMHENNSVTELEMIFSASSFTEIYSRMSALSDIARHDRGIMERLAEVRAYVQSVKDELEAQRTTEETTKAELEQLYVEQEAQQEELMEILARLDAESAEADAALAEVMAIEEEFEALLKAKISEISGVDTKIANTNKKITSTKNAIAAEEAAKKAAQSNASAGSKYTGGTMTWPCPGYYTITSKYGMRTHPVTGVYKLHDGIDIGAPKNAKIVAAAAGTVSTVAYSKAWGNYVIVSHGGGVQTLYAHMTTATCKEGDKVSAGEQIGKVGTTGYSTGYHLHFTVRVNGSAVNPNKYLG